MICPFCNYEHENENDRHGCPNCGGEISTDIIKEARAEAGLTQSAMAELLHVSSKTVQAWEYGTNPMPWAYWTLFQILTKK